MNDDEQPGTVPAAPPVTGNAVIDQALREVHDLSDVPVGQHHDRLSAAHDVLSGVLDSSRGAVQTPIPGVLRPQNQGDHHG